MASNLKGILSILIFAVILAIVPPKTNIAQIDTVSTSTVDSVIPVLQDSLITLRDSNKNKYLQNIQKAREVAMLAKKANKIKARKKVRNAYYALYKGDTIPIHFDKYANYRIFDIDKFIISYDLEYCDKTDTIPHAVKPEINCENKGIFKKIKSLFKRK